MKIEQSSRGSETHGRIIQKKINQNKNQKDEKFTIRGGPR